MASFLKTRRGEGGRSAEPGAAGEVAEPPPPTDTWAAALATATASVLDTDPAATIEPVALPHGYGPWAFSFEVAGDAPRSVLARLATDRIDLEREVAAAERNREHGCATPEIIGVVELDLDPAIELDGDGDGQARPRWALLTDAVTDVALPELIGFNLHHSNDLLDGFAAHHDTIHRLPIDDLEGTIPTVSARDELARIDRSRYPAELAWLDERIPTGGAPVLCHGGYQPLAVFGPPPEAWPDHGGPGKGLTVVNWCAAVLAECEYDMAFTLVAFWSAPFFAPNRSERTAIKMIRNTLLNTYKQGYTARRDIDPDRLRFWQAFHALRGLARLDGAYDADRSPFAASDRGAVPVDLGPELHRHFRQLTRVR
jgi:hypothetical protein